MDDLDQSTQGMPDDNIDIGDVIEVIETDPDYSQQKQQRTPVTTMFNGGEMGQARPRCVIVEEPAQKQLRFRYECEGRSAGSIPGANSTPENKTYPTIKVEGYRGKAVVVVSCVTKDEPFRPHPHKLVGREGCKKGVCTVNIPEDTMTVSFQNLGIQCVKKKDIEEALRTREEIRVDPFRTGFSHRASPTSIDLNAVRLCFQVFLQETRGRYTDLAPVVSNPIYDKKAMSDLVIVKLSDSVCPVDGGNKDIILLCEKVTKEDIQVRFYEEQNGKLIWEGFGEFQPSQVHKQTAISFRPPRYRTLEVIEPVKMFIQLKRPSDGAVSSAVPFQMVSLGRPAAWSLRPITKKRNYSIFSEILAQDSLLQSKRPSLLNTNFKDAISVETQTIENNNNNNYSKCVEANIEKDNYDSKNNNICKTNLGCDEMIDLEKIYEDNKRKYEISMEQDLKVIENFDDTKSYTSLQLAFKNPLDIIIDDIKYEDVFISQNAPALQNPVLQSCESHNPVVAPSPLINIINKLDEHKIPAEIKLPEEEKLPPLPPKRVKKGDIRTYSSKITDINDPSPNMSRENSTLILNDASLPIRSRSLSRHKSQELNAPLRDLPPTPCSTLPKSKKRKFLSGFFSHFSKSANNSREATPSIKAASSHSLNLNRSVGNVSQNSTHIPLKDKSENLDDLNQNKVDNSNGNLPSDIDLNLDLTEAEHYALYTTMAPHATQSEFDETSCYYAPVEGGKILEVQANNKT